MKPKFSYTKHLEDNVNVRLLELARTIAETSFSRYRVGCVIARKTQPMYLACNDMLKTHPDRDPRGMCAEFKAINRATTDIANMDIYVVRIKRDGSPGLAKPCVNCERDIRERSIRRVIYSTSEYPYYEVMKLYDKY